ncbi:MAG: putative cytosolic protein [Deltaproteobacteria bacterium]|nr:putative cytosolic protein [Deltaproteobacteria bacterium]
MTAGPFSKESVGEFLRRERESRRVALEEISKSTRINRPYLEALERNDFRFFSKPEYIRGFLKGYARHIGLDPNEVLKRYEFQMELARLKGKFHQLPLFSTPGDSTETAEAEQSESPPPAMRKKKFPVPRSILIQIIILVAALSISFYLYRTLNPLDRTPSMEKKEIPPNQATPKPEKNRNEKPVSGSFAEKSHSGNQDAKPSGDPRTGTGGVKEGEKGDSGRIQSDMPKKKTLGNPESKTYYLPGMKDYEKVRKGRVVEFGSEEEAIKRGYRKAFL